MKEVRGINASTPKRTASSGTKDAKSGANPDTISSPKSAQTAAKPTQSKKLKILLNLNAGSMLFLAIM